MRCTLLLLATSLGGASVPRRAVLRLAGASLAASPLPSLALFESPEQLALIGLATAQPKVNRRESFTPCPRALARVRSG